MFSRNSIQTSNFKLFYYKLGNGKEPLLLFHGFGQTHRAFNSWNELSDQYTLYLFDLFFHGESTWHNRLPIEKKDWKKILKIFLEKEGLERFSIGGFSMGGKFALSALESFPTQINRIILLAPDGIKTSFWYSLATYPIAIRSLFKSMILHPNRLYKITKALRAVKLIDNGLLRFAELQMDTEEKRRRVYYSWVYFRHFKFDLALIAKLIHTHKIDFVLYTGRYDKVIPPENMNRLLKHLPSKYSNTILEAGHNDLINKSFLLLKN